MKKIFLLLFLSILATSGFGQAADINARNIKLENRLYSTKSGSIDTIIAPSKVAGEYKVKNVADPTADKDAVNLRFFNANALTSPTRDLDFTPIYSGNEAWREGRVYYDTLKHSLTYITESVNMRLNVGQEGVKRAMNNTGALIPNNTPVYLDGNNFQVADCNTFEKSRIIGVTTEDIPAGKYGYATLWGEQSGNFTAKGFVEGDDLYLGAGVLTKTPPSGGQYVVYIGEVQNDTTLFVLPNVNQYTAETMPVTGFPKSDDSYTTISWNNTTRTVTLSPVGASQFYYYQKGIKYFSGAKSLQISNVEGVHFIYLDGETIKEVVNPTHDQVVSIYENNPGVCKIYWSVSLAQNIYTNNQRHSIYAPSRFLSYHYDVDGCVITKGSSGLTNITSNGNGSLPAHAQFGVAAGTIWNQDIYTVCSPMAYNTGINVYYRSGTAGDWKLSRTNFPLITAGTGRMAYNQLTGGTWQLTEAVNNSYVLVHVVASNTVPINTSGEKYGVILGQANYTTLTAARAAAEKEAYSLLYGQFPANDIALIGTVIFNTADNISNTVKSRVVQTADGLDYIDLRFVKGGSGGSGAAATSFVDLLDTPSSYAGSASKLTRVNAAESGIEFVSPSAINVSAFNDDQKYMDNATHNVANLTGQYVDVASIQTLTNKTLTSPTIANFTNANHNHSTAATGGQINSDAIIEGSTNLFSAWTKSGGNVYRSTGNVGVGGTPTTKLDVYGTTRTQTINITNSMTLAGLTIDAVATGTGDNNKVTTKGYVDDKISQSGGYSDEDAQDAVGTILDNGAHGDIIFTYDDDTPRISADVKDDSHAHTSATISGLTTSDFANQGVAQWTNDAGYVPSTYTLTGDLSGTLAAPEVVDNSHNHTIANVTGLQTAIDSKQATLSGTGLVKSTAGTISYISDNSANWNSAYTDRLKWDGGSSGLVAATGRTSLGATTVGGNVFTSTNPSAITFLRANADNTISWLNATDFRTAIGAGTSSTVGTVTSVSASAPVGMSIAITNETTTPNIALALSSGYSIPTIANQNNWTNAYSYSQIGHLPLSGGTLTGALNGTSATFTGTVTAPTFVKSGGTSSQFLKADGSVDSNTYLTTDGNQTVTGIKTFNSEVRIGADPNDNYNSRALKYYYGSSGSSAYSYVNSTGYMYYVGVKGAIFRSSSGVSVSSSTGNNTRDISLDTQDYRTSGGSKLLGVASAGSGITISIGAINADNTHAAFGRDGGVIINTVAPSATVFPTTEGLAVGNTLPTGKGNIDATGTVTAPTFAGALTGNASTATKLATARTIWGQSFDGSADVSGSITGATTIAASGLATLSGGISSTSATFSGTVTAPNVVYGSNLRGSTPVGAVSLNTLTKSGFYYAGSSTTDVPSAVSHEVIHTNWDNGDNYAAQLAFNAISGGAAYFRNNVNGTWTGWNQLWHSGNANSTSYDWSAKKLTLAGAITGATTIAASGTVTAPTFAGALTGNAATSTKLATARTIWGQSFDGSANVSGALTGVTDITAVGDADIDGTLTVSGEITAPSFNGISLYSLNGIQLVGGLDQTNNAYVGRDGKLILYNSSTNLQYEVIDERDVKTQGINALEATYTTSIYNNSLISQINVAPFTSMGAQVQYTTIRQVKLMFVVSDIIYARTYKLRVSNINGYLDFDFANASLETINSIDYLTLSFSDPDWKYTTGNQRFEIFRPGVDESGIPTVNKVTSMIEAGKSGALTGITTISSAAQLLLYSSSLSIDVTQGMNSVLTLNGNTALTLTGLADGMSGDIAITQNSTGGYGITSISALGFTVKYINGQAPTAAYINSAANGVSVVSYKVVGTYLFINYSGY